MKLTRSENVARWFAIVMSALIGMIALFDSYNMHLASKSWLIPVFDGLVLLLACTGFVFKKRFGPVLYLALTCIKSAGPLMEIQNRAALFGTLIGAAVPVVISIYLFRAFSRTTIPSTKKKSS